MKMPTHQLEQLQIQGNDSEIELSFFTEETYMSCNVFINDSVYAMENIVTVKSVVMEDLKSIAL